ncbi:MAG: glycosyltransferase, partial [Phycisphaerae bacterium]|nr:glycosyltransferase [Phycisphaerae bacterium]
LPHAKFVGWYEDSLDGFTDTACQITRQLDWLLATGGGDHLQAIAEKCKVRAAFMPNPCDPDVENNYPTSPDRVTDILFTGKLSHKSRGTDTSRKDLIELLQKKHQLTIFGSQGQPAVLGLEYFRRISATRIALSVNASSDIRMYHSDRLINYLACGAFVLSKSVPDGRLLFEDGKHLRYFDTAQQCLDLVDHYLSHPEERQKIAAAAMENAHQNFNGASLAKDVIDLIQTGTYNRPWAEII